MQMPKTNPAVLVAIILAVGISLSLIFMTISALWVVTKSPGQTLGENTTQVLTGWGGGMLGVLGAFVGYAFGGGMKGDEKEKDFLPPAKPYKPPKTPPPSPPVGPSTSPPTSPPDGKPPDTTPLGGQQ